MVLEQNYQYLSLILEVTEVKKGKRTKKEKQKVKMFLQWFC